MIQRRQFLGAIGASCLTAGSFASQAFAHGPIVDDLNWRCDVIKTIGHGRGYRSPVVTGVSLQPHGNLLAIVGDDHHVGIFDHVGQQYVDHLGIHTDWVRATRFSPDGKSLATAGNDRTVRNLVNGRLENARIYQKPSPRHHRGRFRQPESLVGNGWI